MGVDQPNRLQHLHSILREISTTKTVDDLEESIGNNCTSKEMMMEACKEKIRLIQSCKRSLLASDRIQHFKCKNTPRRCRN